MFQPGLKKYLLALSAIMVTMAALVPLREHANATTVALALLLAVLFSATFWGSRPALAASALAMLCFNFFFLPPFGTLTIADPQNWVALLAFLITALTVGQLSARVKRRAEEAEARQREVERLYQELQAAFARASQAEALRQSERLKSALLDAVTHDLRTPLTSIKASVTTLLDEAVSLTLDAEGRQELLEVINEETDRLNHFVASLVELAQIEAGALQLRRRWSTAEEIVAAALARARALTRAHRVEIALENELPALRVDAQTMAEVIYTLLDNATRYAPPGTRIRVTAARTPGAAIRFAVEDEGCGVPVALRERVFDKFFRAPQAETPSRQRSAGIGLGLAIARGLIEAHNGRIWVEDGAGGRGTRFSFTLPIGADETAFKQEATA